MRIRVVNSIVDGNGNQTPMHMIGNEYDVIKEDQLGVWVRAEGKLDAFVYYDELEIVELNENYYNTFGHYLRNTTKEKYFDELKSMGCDHLL
ncbi:hypothetical protein V7138_22495 [Bacillus sp. JJ1533]|uniref:hypothetical protein n=1 Tax=Bacillus sp. JJ1533 TaxID=3122959 RepID=UPI002FFFD841